MSQKLRILLIDDDPDIRSLLRMALSAEHDISEAENGVQGLIMLDRFQPDLVVCDIMMPLMDGIETVVAIRKNPKYIELPVFFLSGESHPDMPELTREAGGNLFVSKPVDPFRMLELINTFVEEFGISSRPLEKVEAVPKPSGPPILKPVTHFDVELDNHPTTKLEPIRILTIDANPASLRRMGALLSANASGRWECLWSTDPGECASNLYRLQPDLILYNPRQRMAGIAFLHNLHLRQILHEQAVCFFGPEISASEAEYNFKMSGREPIILGDSDEDVLKKIAFEIVAARRKWRKKRHAIEEIAAQDRSREAKLAAMAAAGRVKQFQAMQSRINAGA